MLEKHIKDQLSRNGKVSVPGLGTFQKHPVSAQLDETSGAINQPKYKITYASDTDTDGEAEFLMAVSQNEGLDAEDSRHFVQQKVDEILAQMKSGGSYQFYEIGTLRETGFNRYELEDAYLTDDNFGLPGSIPLKPINRYPDNKDAGRADYVPTPAKPQEKKIVSVVKKESNFAVPVLLIALTLVAAALLYYFFMYKKDNTVATKKPEQTEQTEQTTENTEAPSEQSNTETTENTTTDNFQTSSSNTITEKINRYHIIVGGFAVKENAERLRTELAGKGFDSKIILPNQATTLYRVTIGDYPTIKEALAQANTKKSEFQSTPWVLKY